MRNISKVDESQEFIGCRIQDDRRSSSGKAGNRVFIEIGVICKICGLKMRQELYRHGLVQFDAITEGLSSCEQAVSQSDSSDWVAAMSSKV